MKMIKFCSKLKLSFVALIFASFTPLFSTKFDISSTPKKFNRVMEVMEEIVSKKITPFSNFERNSNPMNILSRDITEACERFESLSEKFCQGAFKDFKTIRNSFIQFCKAIDSIDRSIKIKVIDTKPWHVRWIKEGLSEILKSIQLNEKKIHPKEDGPLSFAAKTAHEIKIFAGIMNGRILPYFSTYIGTSFEKNFSDRLRRIGRFVLKNWWWEIPIMIGLTKFGYDAFTHLDKQRKNPSKANWYKKLLSYTAGAFFATKLGKWIGPNKMDNLIYDDGLYTFGPIDEDLDYEENVYWPPSEFEIRVRQEKTRRIFDQRVHSKTLDKRKIHRKAKFKAIQYGSLRQEENTCAIYAAFNVVCMLTNNFKLMRDREAFEEYLTECRECLEDNGMPTTNLQSKEIIHLIQNIDLLKPLRGNRRMGLSKHVIIDELPWIERMIRQGSDAEYEYEYENFLYDDLLKNTLKNKATKIAAGERIPLELKLIAKKGFNHNRREEILEFRRDGGRLGIILNTGGFHWIAVLFDGDTLAFTDSNTDSVRTSDRRIKRIYHAYKLDEIDEHFDTGHEEHERDDTLIRTHRRTRSRSIGNIRRNIDLE
jgi:hypothetical protein